MVRSLEKILLGIYLFSLPLSGCTHTKEEILVNTKNAQLIEVFYPSVDQKPVGVYVVHEKYGESIEIPEWDISIFNDVINGDTLDVIRLGDRKFMIHMADSSFENSLDYFKSKTNFVEFKSDENGSIVAYGDTLPSNLIFSEYLKNFFNFGF